MWINRLIFILITSLNNRKQINRSIKIYLLIFLKLTGRGGGLVDESLTLHIVDTYKLYEWSI